jgi:cytoskeletal protein CcmA (bactofilin family)
MFKDKTDGGHPQNGGNQTIIAQGVKVEGDFHSNGDVVIDGELTGSIETSQSLQIGESARISANVIAKSAVIAGQVHGNISATDRLELTETSKVDGDIQTGSISVAVGAVMNGNVTMGKMNGRAQEAETFSEEDEV